MLYGMHALFDLRNRRNLYQITTVICPTSLDNVCYENLYLEQHEFSLVKELCTVPSLIAMLMYYSLLIGLNQRVIIFSPLHIFS